jgi:hypothetical protein
MSRSFASMHRLVRSFSTSSKASWSSSTSRTAVTATTGASSVPKTSAYNAIKPATKRTAYARVARPASGVSTFRKPTSATPSTLGHSETPAEQSKSETTAPFEADLSEIDQESFINPQPVSELPDYARLAPPVDHIGDTGAQHVSAGAVMRLSESPVQSDSFPRAGEDWTTSFYGLSAKPFSREVAEVLLRALSPSDIEIKPGQYT